MEVIASGVLTSLMEIVAQQIKETVGQLGSFEKEVEKLSRNLESIRGVLEDADQRQVEDKMVKLWVDELKDISYDMEDVLDESKATLLKSSDKDDGDALVPDKKVRFPRFFSGFGFKQALKRRDIVHKIKKLNDNLDHIVREKDMFRFKVIEKPERLPSSSLVDTSEIFGREEETRALMDMLLSQGSEERTGLQVISIVGMAGIGKTALAKQVYNKDTVKGHFDKRVWVSVSPTFDLLRIAKMIIESLEGSVSNLSDLHSCLMYISRSIVGKRIFLVLDEVWTENYNRWEPLFHCLNNGHHGSIVLITSRKESVARRMQSTNMIMLRELSQDDSLSLFRQFALSDSFQGGGPDLEGIVKEIIYKCRGLPLAIKAVGSLLRQKHRTEEWVSILRDEIRRPIELDSLFSVLRLSYNHLPFSVRRCFSYCAIFPEGYLLDKDKLIKLWMAQGYLETKENEDMERVGEKYFQELEIRSLIQKFEGEDDSNIVRYKMHDLVHDFVRSLSRNEYLTDDLYLEKPRLDSYVKVRHLMLILNEGVSFPNSILSAKKLRSLLIQYGVENSVSISEVLPKLFDELTSLRAIDLSAQLGYENVILEIPSNIEKLVHLKYLNLSSLNIEVLPDSLCGLYNLQALELSWCVNLKRLPKGMGELINLRHIANEGTSLSYMPKGIERLTCLRTLSELIVGGGGVVDDKEACTLACLKNLKYLRGSLIIKKLGTVTNVSEAKEAKLKKKRNLIRLYLNFDNDKEEGMTKEYVAVLEALQPPPHLKFLEIRDFKGDTMFPNWIRSLTNLTTLNIHDGANLVRLPPLGILQSLESLSIWSMGRVKEVGNEFLEEKIDGASSSSSINSFPKLKFLKFGNMEEWEDWHCGITSMTSLLSLSVIHCPKLKALPDCILRSKLEELNISWCPILKDWLKGPTGDYQHNISNIPKVIIDFE